MVCERTTKVRSEYMHKKCVQRGLHVRLAVAVAVVVCCLFFSPFATKALADGSFEISDWLSGYGSSSLQSIYKNNKPAMDAASTWKFTTSRVTVGGSSSTTTDFVFPTTVTNVTSTYSSSYLGNGTRVQPYSSYVAKGTRVVFPAGFNGTVSNMIFEGEVSVEAGANVTFDNVTFYKGLDNKGTSTVKNSTVVQQDLTTTDDSVLNIENTRFQNSDNSAGITLPSNKISSAKVGAAYNEPVTIPWAAASKGYDTFTMANLPDGLTLSPMENDAAARKSTATISGTPTTAQKNHVVRATIKNGTSYDFTIPMMMDVEKGTVAVPTATNYDYDGQEHNGYDISAHLNVAINGTIAATHAGTYEAVMDLIDPVNYTWEDGTTGTKTGSWTIRKAHLTATYEGETIEEGKTPELKLNVIGFVNGETADTAYQYTAPTLTASDVSVGDYELTPTGGAAGDYDFTYVAGTLKVTKAAVQPGGQSNNQGGSQNGSQGGSQGNNQQQNETGKAGKTGKKVKSGKKSVIPDMSDPAVISTVAGFTVASIGSIAAGIALRKRA